MAEITLAAVAAVAVAATTAVTTAVDADAELNTSVRSLTIL